jgi:hypothetical protein
LVFNYNIIRILRSIETAIVSKLVCLLKSSTINLMIATIATTLIFGKPLVIYLGFLTLLSLLFTASIGYTTVKGIKWVPFKFHPVMAITTIIIALIHGILGASIYFNF